MVSYWMIVAFSLLNDIKLFVSDDSRKWFPFHGAALNGFWMALASELVVLASDPFQQQSLLGWRYLEWIELGLKHTIIWSSFVPALILWLIHSEITEFLLFVIIVGHTVKEKGLFSQFFFSFAFDSILFKTLTLHGHNQLSSSKIKYFCDINTKSGTSYKKDLRESLHLIDEQTDFWRGKRKLNLFPFVVPMDDIKICKWAITIDWTDISFSRC